MAKTIYRIACYDCDKSADHVTKIPDGWKGVSRYQSLKESYRTQLRPGEFEAPPWYTHLGYCPDCAEENRAEWDDSLKHEVGR